MATPFGTRCSGGGTRGVGEALILKRRQREESLANYTASVQGNTKLNSRAEWEESLRGKGETQQVMRTVTHLKNQHESQLHSRRLQLAELYNSEMEGWRDACLANAETPEDRKQKMIQRALELKERRERERLAIVEEKRLQQYRESCDDIRVEDSNKIQQLVLTDRELQLEERKKAVEKEREFEDKMAQLWLEDRLKKEERERKDAEMALKRDEEMKAILDLQVGLVQKRRIEAEEHKRLEDNELLSEWDRLRQVEEDLERRNREKEILRALDVKKFNQERVEANHLATERERLYDKCLLEQALAQEAATQRHEKDLQEKFRKEQLEYQQMLRRQMETEAEDLSHLDKIRKDMEDAVWAKSDAQHNAEEAARQELLRQVLISRADQIEMKRVNKIQAKEQDTAYMNQIKRDAEEALQKELREQEERQKELKRTQSDILRLQEERRVAEEQKKQAEFLEHRRMLHAEKQHKERVKQFSTHMPTTSFRRKKAQWYFDA
ncbi:Cilia- and flagella-associated protein 53 [Phytophthora boehmeriae]|uniref:Cilia- and flagella-associated protein 53 n=1 Tax=Phytophthora boehmeriae TaxID=109152 RepID=A0A8T1WT04_9STRA|nr:Cilia- and flagella-associated protein 53 [Phytophthora boehmeriae]